MEESSRDQRRPIGGRWGKLQFDAIPSEEVLDFSFYLLYLCHYHSHIYLNNEGFTHVSIENTIFPLKRT
jgi:hypothetical protein